MDRNKIQNEIRKIFKEKKMCHEWLIDSNGDVLVNVVWGDWKHDHIYLVNVMKENGYILTSKVITEENGTDAYTAEYLFTKDTSKV